MRSLGVCAPAVLTALVLAGSPLSAQRKELTVLAGANYSGATGGNLYKTQSQSGFLGGLSFRLPRSAQVSFQPEFLVIWRRLSGERAPSTLPPVQVGPISDAAKLLYAEIPLMLRFQRGYSSERPVRPFLTVGPYVGIRLGCRRDVLEGDSTLRHTDCSVNPTDILVGNQPLVSASYQDVDVGGVASIGVEIRRMSIGVRVERSIVSLVEPGAVPTSPFDKTKLWSGTLTVEYLLRVL
jgi:outer membrane protein with beta-barrel domain